MQRVRAPRSGSEGTSATTDANDTATASGALTIAGLLAITEDGDTGAASGIVAAAVTGTCAVTEEDHTCLASSASVLGFKTHAKPKTMANFADRTQKQCRPDRQTRTGAALTNMGARL